MRENIYVLCFVVRAVSKFGFRLATDVTLKKLRPVEGVMQLWHLQSCKFDDRTSITPVVIFPALQIRNFALPKFGAFEIT